MNIFKIRTMKQLEEMIGTWYKLLPPIPKNVRKIIVETTPYLAFVTALYLFSISIIPFIYPEYPLDIVSGARLISLNVYLMRFSLGIIALGLFFAFKPLSLWKLKGWYSLFYISIIQILLSLIFFNAIAVLIVLIEWYILFNIKSEYAK